MPNPLPAPTPPKIDSTSGAGGSNTASSQPSTGTLSSAPTPAAPPASQAPAERSTASTQGGEPAQAAPQAPKPPAPAPVTPPPQAPKPPAPSNPAPSAPQPPKSGITPATPPSAPSPAAPRPAASSSQAPRPATSPQIGQRPPAAPAAMASKPLVNNPPKPASAPVGSPMRPGQPPARPGQPQSQPARPQMPNSGMPPARPGQPGGSGPQAPRPAVAPQIGQRPPSAGPVAPLPPRAPGAPGALPPQPPGGLPPAGQPIPAKATRTQSSIFKFLPFIIGGLVLLGVVGFFLMRMLGGGSTSVIPGDSTGTVVPGEETKLTYWGLWEPSEVMTEVFNDFSAANPGVTVEYIKQSPADYRERLQTAIAQGTGPDLFRFHAAWTPMLRDDLAPVPSSAYTPSSFQSTFYPVATEQLTYNGSLRGIPLMYDGLALFYNEDILKNADAQPPQTWADLRILATQLTVTTDNNVERGGLAIGNATNVEHFADILGLLMLQNGADLTNPSSPEAREALIFYTDFLKTYKVWSDDLPSSTVAFARGDVAMMFAPSWRAHEVLAQNPNLKFGIAPLPKLGTSQAAWASYWAEGVNAKSTKDDLAWKLLTYMSSPEVMQKMYSQQAQTRKFGELYSRRDLADQLVSEPLAAAYLSDAPQAKGWYMSSFTHDNGINDQIIKYYKDAITAVLDGTSPESALVTVSQGVSQVLRQYGVPISAPPAAAPTTSGTQIGI